MDLPRNTNKLAADVSPGCNQDRAEHRAERLVYRALTFTGAAGAALALADGDFLITRISFGVVSPAVGSRSAISSSFAGLCLTRGTTLRCDDSETDPRVDAAVCRALSVRSMVLVPVRDAEKTRGLIAVFSAKPNAFSETHAVGLENIAASIGEALELAAPPTAFTPARVAASPNEEDKCESALAMDRSATENPQILRFRPSERAIHWSIAIPFMVCFATALVLVMVYNPHPLRPYRYIFAWLHRVSGACLMVFPVLAALRNRNDYRIHWYNVKQAWAWAIDDIKWLLLMGAATLSRKISLPEQGKFNAAEKVNFIMVMCTYPLFIATGLILWTPRIAFLSWVIHVAMAAVATPLMLGHIFMATINSDTRVGLSGMLTGFVDREWAKHHYTRWYRENFHDDQEVLACHNGERNCALEEVDLCVQESDA